MNKVVSYLAFLCLLFAACQKEVSEDLTIPFLKTDSTVLSFVDLAGKKDSFNIQSNIQWKITVLPASADWLQLSIDSGNGNVKIYVTTVKNNTSDSTQKATLVISPANNITVQPATIEVTQGKPAVKPRNAYGGSEADELWYAVVTPDGGHIAVGITASNNGDITGLHGIWEDVWIIKVDANGNKVWSKVMGGSGRDGGGPITKTADGNYLIAAFGEVADGDLAGAPGGGLWMIKINGNGDVLWKKVIAGVSANVNDIKPANGGGYILAGTDDIWAAKIDENANLIWQKSLGGSIYEVGMTVEPVSGGGYLVVGTSQSTDGDILGHHGSIGSYDMVVAKLDENGNKVWLKCFGGGGDENGTSILKTNDGNFIISGYSNSNDGDVSGNHGGSDLWILKIDGNGNKLWQKSYGGSGGDGADDMISTSDGGYIIAGTTESNDGDITGIHGDVDGWIVKIDASGNKLWQKTLGGTDSDWISCVVERSAGNYTAIGLTWSNNGDVVGYKGDSDGWIMKFTN